MVSSSETDSYIKTSELVAKIRDEFNVKIDVRTVTAWVSRQTDPLPTAFHAKRGQSRLFDWEQARPWIEREISRPLGAGIEGLDWHGARTISARAKARKDLLELGVLERRYVDARAVERTAEDRARQAVNLLRTIPSRVAPTLVGKDELEIDRLLDAEIRRVCAAIEQAAREAIAGEADDEDLDA